MGQYASVTDTTSNNNNQTETPTEKVIIHDKATEKAIVSDMPNYDKLYNNKTYISHDTDKYVMKKLYHTDNQNIIVDKETFKKRYTEYVGNLFDGFEWSNCALAGGSVLGMMEVDSLQSKYESSDLDLFVYSTDKTKLAEKINYVLDFLNTRNINITGYFLYNNTRTIDIISANKRNIQIIGVSYDSAYQVINNFDIGNSQICYNGHDIIYTDLFTDTMKTRAIDGLKTSAKLYRYNKAIQRGFMITNQVFNRTTKFGKIGGYTHIVKKNVHDKPVIVNGTKQENVTVAKLQDAVKERNDYVAQIDAIKSGQNKNIKIGSLFTDIKILKTWLGNQYQFVKESKLV